MRAHTHACTHTRTHESYTRTRTHTHTQSSFKMKIEILLVLRSWGEIKNLFLSEIYSLVFIEQDIVYQSPKATQGQGLTICVR